MIYRTRFDLRYQGSSQSLSSKIPKNSLKDDFLDISKNRLLNPRFFEGIKYRIYNYLKHWMKIFLELGSFVPSIDRSPSLLLLCSIEWILKLLETKLSVSKLDLLRFHLFENINIQEIFIWKWFAAIISSMKKFNSFFNISHLTGYC